MSHDHLGENTHPLYQIKCTTEAETQQIAQAVSNILGAGDIICLWGDLGVGKSTFARAVIETKRIEAGPVPSPTFTLVQSYETAQGELYHFDLYRVEDEHEILELGIDDAFSDGISLIEWPDRLGIYLPWDRLDILLVQDPHDDQTRILEFHATHRRWEEKLVGIRG